MTAGGFSVGLMLFGFGLLASSVVLGRSIEIPELIFKGILTLELLKALL